MIEMEIESLANKMSERKTKSCDEKKRKGVRKLTEKCKKE